mmetsp:Transcript_34719/g.87281  ORF Transcript_34719/g.87281 Transcript_34719/m.87281 type:complete len:317 (-) Transcript_34719:4641-5591(-)
MGFRPFILKCCLHEERKWQPTFRRTLVSPPPSRLPRCRVANVLVPAHPRRVCRCQRVPLLHLREEPSSHSTSPATTDRSLPCPRSAPRHKPNPQKPHPSGHLSSLLPLRHLRRRRTRLPPNKCPKLSARTDRVPRRRNKSRPRRKIWQQRRPNKRRLTSSRPISWRRKQRRGSESAPRLHERREWPRKPLKRKRSTRQSWPSIRRSKRRRLMPKGRPRSSMPRGERKRPNRPRKTGRLSRPQRRTCLSQRPPVMRPRAHESVTSRVASLHRIQRATTTTTTTTTTRYTAYVIARWATHLWFSVYNARSGITVPVLS